MPRQARKKSASGIYHIMLRGIDQRTLFYDSEDNQKFLDVLKEYKEVCQYKILAYCLMGNHIHLLLKTDDSELAQIFKRIGGKYVYWYNAKYKRIGHLFQDRFKSEPVDTDGYLLNVLRYIHQNPVKSGLCKSVDKYIYSSYKDYIDDNQKSLTDTQLIYSIIDKKTFVELNNQPSDEQFMDITPTIFKVTDEEAMKIITKTLKIPQCTDLCQLESKKQAAAIKKLSKQGISIRQLSRLTGLSKRIVELSRKT